MQIQIQTQIQIVIWVDMHLCIPPIYLFVLDDAKREGFLVPPTPRATKFNIFLLLKCQFCVVLFSKEILQLCDWITCYSILKPQRKSMINVFGFEANL